MLRKNKKSQTWISDYAIGLLLFIMGAILAVKILTNSFITSTDFDGLKTDASKISELLISEGYPSGWTNETNVIKLGLETDKRMDPAKVFVAMNMTYPVIKSKLQTNNQFVVIFENSTGDIIEFSGLCTLGSNDVFVNETAGDCHFLDFSSVDYDNLVKINRFVVYNSEIVRMVVYLWS